ncbi:MAG: TIGR03016 family PEP-CTERM system-associated outer membrane protein, partial [Dechloromonas sp.]|nr:TIGR03016 family PEP-CTERM system-associated outer membrane protein [Dechloromonas sp.]
MKNNSARLSIACSFIIVCLSSTVSADPGEQGARSIAIKPRITLTETWSDNVALSSGQNGKESGLITELAPGIRVEARTARLKAYFDYALRGQFYSTSSGSSRTQNSLNTFGTLEAVTNWLFLDFSG